MSDLLELALRVEALAGPDREIDALIGGAVGAIPREKNVYRRGYYPSQLVRVDKVYPKYTASLDAAMTLMPDGQDMMFAIIDGKAYAGLGAERGEGDVEPATLPLALTAACLRALAPRTGGVA